MNTQATKKAPEIAYLPNTLDNFSGRRSPAPETPPAKYSVRIATTIDEIKALRSVWTKWAVSLESDFDHFLYCVTRDPTVLRPCVIAVSQGDNVRGMLVGHVRTRRAHAIVSFLNIPGPSERVLVIKKGGRIGQPSPEIDRLLASELLKIARSGEVDCLSFERLPLQSELFRQIQQLHGFLVRVLHVFGYSELTLAGPERKIRPKLRRKLRALDRAFEGQVLLKRFSHPSEVDEGYNDAMQVVVKTWQYHLDPGFVDTEQTRDTLRFFAERGWLRIYVLHVKEKPCAYFVGLLHNNTFYSQHQGYDPAFSQYSVGTLLTALAFEDLAAMGVQRVDLGEGGQEHNRRLGCQRVEEGNVHVYSPTLRGVLLSVFFGGTQLIRTIGRRACSRLGLNWADAMWRRLLISRWKVNARPSEEAMDVYRTENWKKAVEP
jgi:hypothetical protein